MDECIFNLNTDFIEYKLKGVGKGYCKTGQRKPWKKQYYFEQDLLEKQIKKLGVVKFTAKFACLANKSNHASGINIYSISVGRPRIYTAQLYTYYTHGEENYKNVFVLAQKRFWSSSETFLYYRKTLRHDLCSQTLDK